MALFFFVKVIGESKLDVCCSIEAEVPAYDIIVSQWAALGLVLKVEVVFDNQLQSASKLLGFNSTLPRHVKKWNDLFVCYVPDAQHNSKCLSHKCPCWCHSKWLGCLLEPCSHHKGLPCCGWCSWLPEHCTWRMNFWGASKAISAKKVLNLWMCVGVTPHPTSLFQKKLYIAVPNSHLCFFL